MTHLEFVRLVADLRRAQRYYFSNRTERSLEKAKQLERQVDLAVKELLQQPTLFPTDREPD